MEEKSGRDILIENLVKLGLTPDVHAESRTNVLSGRDRIFSTSSVVVQLSDSTYFLARNTGLSHTFTGIYSSIKLPVEAEYKVRCRNWFDFLFFPKRKKLGVKYIDDRLTIVSSGWTPSREISSEVVNLFLKINKTGKPYKIIVDNNYFSIIESLKDKKIVGIETDVWLYEKEDLKQLLDIGGKIISKMKGVGL